MCDLVGQNHDLYYDNLKSILLTRLDGDKEQLDTLEK